MVIVWDGVDPLEHCLVFVVDYDGCRDTGEVVDELVEVDVVDWCGVVDDLSNDSCNGLRVHLGLLVL